MAPYRDSGQALRQVKKIGVISLGCSKNLVDTEVMLAHLTSEGFTILEEFDHVDCVLVNTCAFLTEAITESLDEIMAIVRIKEEGRTKRLVVTGCMVSRFGDRLLEQVPEIDGVVHPTDLAGVVEAVTGRKKTAKKEEVFPARLRSFPYHRAYVKIGEGCSNHCTYCTIPGIRGEFSSRELSSITDEIRWLLDEGTSEITLVSQDTGRYGLDGDGLSLAHLVSEILRIPGDYWLRVMYVHPSRVNEELLGTLASDDRVCPYLDIPFQHVSKKILELMGRGSAPGAGDVISMARERIPGLYLRTTLMTGFPGETGGDFEKMLEFVRTGQVNHLGVFPYSLEEGTLAAGFQDQVPVELARERMEILLSEQEKMSASFLRSMVGRVLKVMAEGADENGAFGRHRGQAPEVDGVVYLDSSPVLGDVVNVEITGSSTHDLTGKVQV